MSNAITTLVGEELEGDDKWSGTLATPNGSLYGVPDSARRVAKFNPVDKSMTHIRPDLGGRWKWCRGAITNSGVIYCVPRSRVRGILKIDTNTDTIWMPIFFQNEVIIYGDHVLPLSMDAFTLCRLVLIAS